MSPKTKASGKPESGLPSPSDLEKMRHSLAHVLAQAVLKLWPETLLTIGPPIEYGCYYDFLFPVPISAADFPKIEKEMRATIHQGQTFRCDVLSTKDAKAYWKLHKQPFKVELIEDLERDEGVKTVTQYVNIGPKGEEMFVDLCRGGHVGNLREIPVDGFQILSLAGAYWRGDETREQLTRIYVAAFGTKAELDLHLRMLEEAKKRDHRVVGREMDLFTFSEMVGPGLPLWTPKGTIIADELERLARETEAAAGYLRVRTPHIAKGKLYEQTGHLKHYQQSMFPPMMVREGGPASAKATAGEEYYLKPMNCPHHHQIFASRPRSYRDLPMRLAEYGHCYRYEDSGALFGLMRVRSLSMNDAHLYCTEGQFEEEFIGVVAMYLKYFTLFGIEKYVMHLSLHDPRELGKKYVDNAALWKHTEGRVRRAMQKAGCTFIEVPNEAAFYGPKIDVQVWSAIGREFTLATNQVDFDVPAKVGLTYVDRDGTEKTPLCIHRAPLGTHERFIGFLIEHFAGHFPLWLAPVQVRILPVAASHEGYAADVARCLLDAGVRLEVIGHEETLGKRIRAAEIQRVPYALVLGDKERSSRTLSVRSGITKRQVTVSLEEFREKTVQDIRERKLKASIG